jgi:D-threo-aldose 1-dehydrogenase
VPVNLSSRRQVGSRPRSPSPSGQGAALKFPLAQPVVISVIAAAVRTSEASATAAHMQALIPPAFWSHLKSKPLIDPEVPTPGWRGANLPNCSVRLPGRDL